MWLPTSYAARAVKVAMGSHDRFLGQARLVFKGVDILQVRMAQADKVM